MTGSESSDVITVARVIKPRGRRGEVSVKDLCDAETMFEAGRKLTLALPGGRGRDLEIEESWRHQGRLVLKFKGVETISDAEELRGAEVQVAKADLPPAEEGEHYYFELIGCTVADAETGRAIGVVEAIQEPGGGLLLEVRRGDQEVLIPYEEPLIVEKDIAGKRILVDLPEGLEELNVAKED